MDILARNKNYILLFLLVGIVAYFPVFLNGFAWDDFPYILSNNGLHQLSLQTIIGPSVFNSGAFYRPIPAAYFGTLYSLFGEHAFIYHFLQVMLHIINSLLLFLLFTRFFPKILASFLALIFLIHPINTESVAPISSTVSEIYFLFGISAFLLGIEANTTRWKLVIISLLLLLAVLTKETGILFLFLILAYRYLYKLGRLGVFMLSGVSLGIVYLLMRSIAGGVLLTSTNSLVPIRQLSLGERLVNIPEIVLYYLKTFIFPWNLIVWQNWIKTVTFQDFVVPLLLCLALLFALLWYSWRLHKHENKHVHAKDKRLPAFIFFAFWYVIGMGLLIQVIPLDMTVAERWFYFPIVGVLGVVGILLQPLWKYYQKYKIAFLAVALILIALLSIRTFVRTLDWKDSLTLYQHDAQIDPNNELLLDQLAIALYKDQRIDEALVYANKSVALSPNIRNLRHLGDLSLQSGQYDSAIKAYTQVIHLAKDTPASDVKMAPGIAKKSDLFVHDAYTNLAEIYLNQDQPAKIMPLAEEGLKRFPDSSQLYFYLAFAAYKTGNLDRALAAIKRSYELSPNTTNTYIYERLKRGLPVD